MGSPLRLVDGLVDPPPVDPRDLCACGCGLRIDLFGHAEKSWSRRYLDPEHRRNARNARRRQRTRGARWSAALDLLVARGFMCERDGRLLAAGASCPVHGTPAAPA